MIPQIRYQVFVSSTYEDLREERQQATQAILEAGCFPSGMELFPASNDTQWELIKRVIEESDYYIVIVAGRYGSLGPAGLSYTEMEYDYAVSRGIPVLGFVRGDVEEVSFKKTEQHDSNRKKLEEFRQKVTTRTCRKYSSPAELGMAVLKSLMAEVRIRPRVGWMRADQARSEDDVLRERKLTEDLSNANAIIEDLEREKRDRDILSGELPLESLAQGDDPCNFVITYSNQERVVVGEEVPLTWNEVFKVIGSSMYGYIVCKRDGYHADRTYLFQDNLEEHIRARIIRKVQNRKIKLEASQLDSCILQFKELGLLRFAETKSDGGQKLRGVTLTEEGERHLALLNIRQRENRRVSATARSPGTRKNKPSVTGRQEPAQ